MSVFLFQHFFADLKDVIGHVAIGDCIMTIHSFESVSYLDQTLSILVNINGSFYQIVIGGINIISLVGFDEVLGGHFRVFWDNETEIFHQVFFFHGVAGDNLEDINEDLIHFACKDAFVGC